MTMKLGANPIARTNEDMPAEPDPAKAHPLTYARKGYATIKATAEKLGLQLA
jgi:hypothetical protein